MMAAIMEEPLTPLAFREMPLPVPGRGEVLVKIEAAPVNPSDLSMLSGSYSVKPNYPYIPGIEGSGTVVGHGKGLLARLRMGKRVACTSSSGRGGTWAEYMVTSADKTVPLPHDISFAEGASSIVNPLTALAFLKIIREGRFKSVVNTAAASALGKMMVRLLKREKITLINIVRRENQVDILRDAGAEYVLVSSAPDFAEEFSNLSNKLNSKIILDSVGGALASLLISESPPGTRLISYASLSGDNISIDPKELLQQNKSVSGFYLGRWLSTQKLTATLKNIAMVKRLISSELSTKIAARMPLSDINNAIKQYRENLTTGKIILIP